MSTTVDVDTIINKTKHAIQQHKQTNSPRPYITLTYAQSLNGSIANTDKSQLRLSGAESKTMTHKLRNIHSGILVGVGTILNDNPILTTRLNDTNNTSSPHPIILDTQCRLYNMTQKYRIFDRKPTICTVLEQTNARVKQLQSVGCTVITVSSLNNHIDLQHCFTQLNMYDSIMVEGGSSVISTMLSQYTHCIDQVIVTIAPLFITGLNVLNDNTVLNKRLRHTQYAVAGTDIVLQGQIDNTIDDNK